MARKPTPLELDIVSSFRVVEDLIRKMGDGRDIENALDRLHESMAWVARHSAVNGHRGE